MNNFNLSDLLIDIDYQKQFTYEQRADIFNKYGYSTSMLFFTPIYHLTTLILNQCGYNENPRYGYGHGKYILDTKMLDKAKEFLPGAPFKYKLINDKKEYLYFRYHRMHNIKTSTGEYVSIDSGINIWNDKTLPIEDALTIKLQIVTQKIPRVNVYQLVNEWLKYFNYIQTTPNN
jgi:hypothetical protein